jgi:hypothetical protein
MLLVAKKRQISGPRVAASQLMNIHIYPALLFFSHEKSAECPMDWNR